MIRRICLFGGPCSGKSTIASKLFSRLKEEHFNIELITEYVKFWAYENRVPEDFDQVYLWAKQMRQEKLALKQADFIITDCPLQMVVAYTKKMGVPIDEDLLSLSNKFNERYPAINIFLKRTDSFPYSEFGRFQNLEQALEMDKIILNVATWDELFPNNDFEKIYDFVKTRLG